MKETWLAASSPRVHSASPPVLPNPQPRQSKRGRHRYPEERMKGMSRSAWVATATVEPSPNHAVCCGVSVPLSAAAGPATTRNDRNTKIATRLFAIGAYIGGENRPRALSTCDTSVNTP